MRNGARQWTRAITIWVGATMLAGCVADNSAGRSQLHTGFNALEQRQYDQAAAIADAYLKKTPQGPGSAEAYYLQGRVYEARSESLGDARRTHADLDAAREAYTRGLAIPSVPATQARLHAGLANVAYFLDDFGSAVREWQLAYPNLEKLEDQAWTLYRIGLCQQRLGWFPQADRTFSNVRQQFPGSEPANRAATHEGAKGFYVQVGAYADAAHAEKAAAALRAAGLNSVKAPEPGGHVVRVGPVPSYADARALQARLSVQYPGAVIFP